METNTTNITLPNWHLEPDYCSAVRYTDGLRTDDICGCVDCHAMGRDANAEWDARYCDEDEWEALPEINGDAMTGDPVCDACAEARDEARRTRKAEVAE